MYLGINGKHFYPAREIVKETDYHEFFKHLKSNRNFVPGKHYTDYKLVTKMTPDHVHIMSKNLSPENAAKNINKSLGHSYPLITDEGLLFLLKKYKPQNKRLTNYLENIKKLDQINNLLFRNDINNKLEKIEIFMKSMYLELCNYRDSIEQNNAIQKNIKEKLDPVLKIIEDKTFYIPSVPPDYIEQVSDPGYITPGEIAMRIGDSNASLVNLAIKNLGYQIKDKEKRWILTKEGCQFGKIYDTGYVHSTGEHIFSLKWKVEIIPDIIKEFESGRVKKDIKNMEKKDDNCI